MTDFFSTDYVAWRATEGMPFASNNVPLPTEDFKFGGAATAGAVFWWTFPPLHGPRDDSESQNREVWYWL